MRCCQCHKLFEYDGIIVTVDGDAVCSRECEIEYCEERDYFLNEVISNDTKYNEWWEQ